jgi:Ser/Thr protein kinase RdoA (MazF antagonist)
MGNDSITKIYAAYGVTPVRLLPMQKGYRNESHPAVLTDGSKVNLIIYKSEPQILDRIKTANLVADHLSDKGLPTRKTIDKRIVKLSNKVNNKYASLYTYLDGDTIPWEAYTQKHIKILGEGMSDLHFFLQLLETSRGLRSVSSEYLLISDQMRNYFLRKSVKKAMENKLNLSVDQKTIAKIQKLLEACGKLEGQQPLHMDFVRSNVLFDKDAAISGIIDFEKAGRGHPILDIARTLAFLLVDCKHKEPEKVYKYFIRSGYLKRGKNKISINTRLLHELTNMFLLHDFYKFLRHNPYEHLHENEHFVRTKDILMQRKLLSSIINP